MSKDFKDSLEGSQIIIYIFAVAAAIIFSVIMPEATLLEPYINPALAFMLFVTFLQVPLTELKKAFGHSRFLAALLITNFIAIPLFVLFIAKFVSNNPMAHLGVFLVLLTPCIDYVVTFSHLGSADSRLLLAATPILLVAQMFLLPVYLQLFLGGDAAKLVQLEPFLHAFIWLIVVPFLAAMAIREWSVRNRLGKKVSNALNLFPVPATAAVLFVVIIAVVPQLGVASQTALEVLPIYLGFAVISPFLGWAIGSIFQLEIPERRSIAFSAATRNSLVVLPLALAVPGAIPVLPAVIVTQTIVELLSELVYIRLIPKWGLKSSP